MKHSISNQTENLLIVIEVQYGEYFGRRIIRISIPIIGQNNRNYKTMMAIFKTVKISVLTKIFLYFSYRFGDFF